MTVAEAIMIGYGLGIIANTVVLFGLQDKVEELIRKTELNRG